MTGTSVRALALAVAATMFAPAVTQAETARVRKDVQALTAEEKRDFVGALHALKRADYPYDGEANGIRWYDQIVEWHTRLNQCSGLPNDHSGIWGHGGPMFLPWHRQYLLMLEDAMRQVTNKHITLPYWDWTNDASTKAVFGEDMMGYTGNPDHGYRLENGPFSYDKWRLNIDNKAIYAFYLTNSTYITRNVGRPEELTVKSDLPFAMSRPVFDAAPWGDATDARKSFRMALEGAKDNQDPITGGDPHQVKGCTGPVLGRGALVASFGSGTLHNQVHGWVGGVTGVASDGGSLVGTMQVPLASPNDPIFFLHHANIDRLWFEWQKKHRRDPYRPRGAAYAEEFPDNEIDSPMHPWDATPRDVAHSEELGVIYASPGRATTEISARRTARRKRTQLLCRLRRL